MARWFSTLALVWFASNASAAEAEIEVDDNGNVVASIQLSTPIDVLRKALADAGDRRLEPETVLDVTSVPDGSDCYRITRTTRGVFSPMTMETRRCHSAEGRQETLVSSDDFSRYSTKWSFEPEDDGTKVKILLDISVNRVPDSLVRPNTIRGLRATLKRIANMVGSGNATD